MAADDVGGPVVTLEAESAVQSKCVWMEAGKEKKKKTIIIWTLHLWRHSLISVYEQIKN